MGFGENRSSASLACRKGGLAIGQSCGQKKTPRSSVIAGQTGYYNSLLKDRSCRAQTKVCSTMVPFMKYPFAEQRTCRQAINQPISELQCNYHPNLVKERQGEGYFFYERLQGHLHKKLQLGTPPEPAINHKKINPFN